MQKIKVKYKDIKTIRDNKILAQNQKCQLCESELDSPVLDHNHKNGEIRSVLCRGCNLMLGKLENGMARFRLTDPDKLRTFLSNVSDYITTGSDLIHPTFKKKKTELT